MRNLLASVADYDDALVSLTGEVARTYALMRAYEEFIQIARDNAKVQKEGLDIAESRFRNGDVRARRSAGADDIREHAGGYPAVSGQPATNEKRSEHAARTPTGRRRVYAQRTKAVPRRFREGGGRHSGRALTPPPRHSFRGVQGCGGKRAHWRRRGGFSPRFFLMGTVGVQSSNAATLFAPHSLALTAGPGIQWSILNYGQITNNVRAQDARFEEAIVNYQDTVLKAARRSGRRADRLPQGAGGDRLQPKIGHGGRGGGAAVIHPLSRRRGGFSARAPLGARAAATKEQAGADALGHRHQSNRALQSLGRRMGDTRRQARRIRSLAGGDGEPDRLGGLLPAAPPPTTPKLPLPTPAGAAPLLLPPDW